ncbi:MAG TPA: hypothetical protein VK192_06580, partial [Sphingomicrobium sp.]|nr:hypothetical protein [Sphingomicrobium sp.]
TGNFSDNPTDAGGLRTRLLLETMQKLGYRAIGLGERDLVSGFDSFKKASEGLDLTFVSTNIVRQGNDEPVVAPYAIVTANGRAVPRLWSTASAS